MPIDYVIDKKNGVVFTQAWGKLTDEDVLAHQSRLRADPAFDQGYRQLANLSQVEQFGLTPKGVRSLANSDPWGAGARRAFVSPTHIAFGMTRMHQILLEEQPQEIAVFRKTSEARRWLGLDQDNPDTASGR
jgi:hypothetical protein